MTEKKRNLTIDETIVLLDHWCSIFIRNNPSQDERTENNFVPNGPHTGPLGGALDALQLSLQRQQARMNVFGVRVPSFACKIRELEKIYDRRDV